METSLISYLPASLAGMVSLEDGVLNVAASLRGDPELLSFLSLAERRNVSVFRFVEDQEVRDRSQTSTSSINTDSDIKQYAVNLMQAAYDVRATDIHLTDNGNVTIIHFRRMGMVTEHSTLPGETGRRLIRAIYQTMSQSGSAQFSPRERQDARIVSREFLPSSVYSARIHTEPIEAIDALDGLGTYMAIRLLYDSIIIQGSITERLEALGYPTKDSARLRFLARRSGMVLLSGPTNSGKSTVLKHVFEGQAAEFPDKNYISIEDPAEYPMRHVKQLKWQLGQSARDEHLNDAHNGVLRCDPNTILFGEIRDAAMAEIALTAALTGHAVWSTIHALNAFEIITRMKNMLVKNYPGDPLDILCNYKVLAGLVYQRLIPTLCSHCKEPVMEYVHKRESGLREGREHILPEDTFNRLLSVMEDGMDTVFVRGPGCECCRNLGFDGMKLAVEVVTTDADLLNFIRKGQHTEAEKYWRERLGGKSHVNHAIEYIQQGLADPAHTEVLLGVPLNINRAMQDFVS